MARVGRVYTVDASVYVSAFLPGEAEHAVCFELLGRFRSQAIPLFAPTLLPVEIAAAVRRGHGDPTLAWEFAMSIIEQPHLMLVPLDTHLARDAVEIAIDYRLRGSDAVYVAVARRYGCVLVTRDREQRERVTLDIVARYPGELLADH